jgi:hypothetical protein
MPLGDDTALCHEVCPVSKSNYDDDPTFESNSPQDGDRALEGNNLSAFQLSNV